MLITPAAARLNRRMLFIAIFVMMFTFCGPVKKIQLPEGWYSSGPANDPPQIEIQNVSLIGTANKAVINSTTAAAPELVTLTPDGDGLAKV